MGKERERRAGQYHDLFFSMIKRAVALFVSSSSSSSDNILLLREIIIIKWREMKRVVVSRHWCW